MVLDVTSKETKTERMMSTPPVFKPPPHHKKVRDIVQLILIRESHALKLMLKGKGNVVCKTRYIQKERHKRTLKKYASIILCEYFPAIPNAKNEMKLRQYSRIKFGE